MKTCPILLWFVVTCSVAQAQFDYTADNGEITITRYTGDGGAVEIPETIEGLPVTHIGRMVGTVFIGRTAFSGRTSLTDVIIPDSVTSIGHYAFNGCTGLTSVTIGNGLNSSIGDRAFYGCTSLTAFKVDGLNPVYSSVEGVLFSKNQDTLIQYPAGKAGSYLIPATVTYIHQYAFRGCTSLSSVIIPDSVTSTGDSAFFDCTGLTEIVIPDSVTMIEWSAFSGCTSLTNVIIPDSVTSIQSYAFDGCTSLIGVYFEGDMPRLWGVSTDKWFSPTAIVYHRAEATRWTPTYDGRPTALWINPPVYGDWIGTTDLPLGSTGSDDSDQDRMNNRAEMLAGTNPADGSSLLMFDPGPRLEDLTDADKTPIQNDQHALYVRSVPGKTYAVQWAGAPIGPWNVDAVFTATTTQMRFVFDRPQGQGYYRVVLAQ